MTGWRGWRRELRHFAGMMLLITAIEVIPGDDSWPAAFAGVFALMFGLDLLRVDDQ